jgi:hypothetical protein
MVHPTMSSIHLARHLIGALAPLLRAKPWVRTTTGQRMSRFEHNNFDASTQFWWATSHTPRRRTNNTTQIWTTDA